MTANQRPQRTNFRLRRPFKAKLRRMVFVKRNGKKTRLDNLSIRAIRTALTSLKSLDVTMSKQDHININLSQHLDIDVGKIQKCDKHIRSVSTLFEELRDDQLYGLSIYLSVSNPDNQTPDHNPDPSNAISRIDEIYRTLKLIAGTPGWFSDVVASIKMDPSKKQQDLWLYHALDELCDILRKRRVIVTRNRDSRPFGLLMDALSLVRPDITPEQVENYLKLTRQGLRKSNFGRRWGEIEDDLPDAEIASSQPSDLDPGAGSDRHPSETT